MKSKSILKIIACYSTTILSKEDICYNPTDRHETVSIKGMMPPPEL